MMSRLAARPGAACLPRQLRAMCEQRLIRCAQHESTLFRDRPLASRHGDSKCKSSCARRTPKRAGACFVSRSFCSVASAKATSAGSDGSVYVTTPIYYVNDKPHIG